MSELSERAAPPAPAFGEFLRYFLVSGAGFGVDVATLAALVEFASLPLLAANTISFSLGMVAVYFASIWWVFDARRLTSARAEFVIFCAIGVVVLGVNHLALLGLVSLVGMPYVYAKVLAAGASFTTNFVVRKLILF